MMRIEKTLVQNAGPWRIANSPGGLPIKTNVNSGLLNDSARFIPPGARAIG